MPFQNPFPEGKPEGRMLTKAELIRAIRLDIAGEQEAIATYSAHAGATDDTFAELVLTAIAEEEVVHIGELKLLLQDLTDGKEFDLIEKGMNEAKDVAFKNEIVL